MPTDPPLKLAILVASASAEQPAGAVTALVHALAARALDCEVEVHFSGPSVRLLVAAVAGAAYSTPQREKSVLAFLREAQQAGAELRACSMAHAEWIKPGETLIEECAGLTGATAFVARAVDRDWQALVY